jgi:hypothetical protein
MATKKASLTTDVPRPKNQGGHGSSQAVTQKTKIQPKAEHLRLALHLFFTQSNLLELRVLEQLLVSHVHN